MPIMVLVVVTAVIGGTMIAKVRSEDLKDQRAWEQVLESDFQTSVKAKQAQALVDRLERLQKQYPDGCPEMDSLASEIAKIWPNFDRTDGNGRLELPSCGTMHRQLKLYAGRG